MMPNENNNLTGKKVCSISPYKLNKNQSIHMESFSERCDPENDICIKLGDEKPSLGPCFGGWYDSIIDGSASPAPNGGINSSTSLFAIKPNNVTSSGCDVRLDGSYICTCKENSTTSSSLLKTATFAATSEAPTPERFYAELDINVPEFVRYISLDYTFTNTGDGDYVYLFAEWKSIWLTSGTAAQQGQKMVVLKT